MRKFGAIVLGLALVAFVGSTVYAGCGGCDAGAKKKSCSEKCLKGLDLTAEQHASVKKLMSECEKIGCDKTSKKKTMAGLKKILSEEQMTKLKAQCKEKGCAGPAGPTAQVLDNQFACGGGCGDKKKDGDETTDALVADNLFACGKKCGGGDKDADDKTTDA